MNIGLAKRLAQCSFYVIIIRVQKLFTDHSALFTLNTGTIAIYLPFSVHHTMSQLSKIITDQVLSLFSSKFTGKAGKLLKNNSKTLKFLGYVQGHFSKVGAKDGLGRFQTVIRMIRAYARGEYKQMPWRTLLSLTGALLYLVAPIDIIPDFLPGLGLLDDIWLLTKVFSLAGKDIENFTAWESGIRTITVGEAALQ